MFGEWRIGLLFGIWKMCVFTQKRLAGEELKQNRPPHSFAAESLLVPLDQVDSRSAHSLLIQVAVAMALIVAAMASLFPVLLIPSD